MRNYAKDLLPIIEMLPKADPTDLKAIRKNIELMAEHMNASLDESGLIIENHQIESYEQGVEIDIRTYISEGLTEKRPGILYIHGGGFTTGSINTEHSIAVDVAKRLNAVTVSVAYRLAPEYRYPSGLYDCYGALQWMENNAVNLKIDANKLAVLGHSAGGGLSASIALMSRDLNGPKIAFQFLGIPELDNRLETVSMKTFDDTPMWTTAQAELSWENYLGKDVDAYDWAAPERVDDLKGLPRTFLSVSEFDPLRDEGINYGKRLLEQGVNVEMKVYSGTFHGSFAFKDVPSGAEQYEDIFKYLKKGLEN